jgi:MFS family permease
MKWKVKTRLTLGFFRWVVVVAAFLINMVADGVTFSFGVYYVEFSNYFKQSKSATAWIGSLLAAMPLLSGPVASYFADRYGCRRVTIVGSLLASTGFLIASFAG